MIIIIPMVKDKLIVLLLLLMPCLGFSQICGDDYMLNKSAPEKDPVYGFFQHYSYLDSCGNVVIADKKYIQAYTENFKTIAFVLKESEGLVAIDKKEKILFHVFWHDNGPDRPSDGLFRITDKGLIGYADLEGKIIIEPKFQCAYPFENGKAKVSNDCKTVREGDHHIWTSKNWYYIHQNGRALME
jgi:hypothetical protein